MDKNSGDSFSEQQQIIIVDDLDIPDPVGNHPSQTDMEWTADFMFDKKYPLIDIDDISDSDDSDLSGPAAIAHSTDQPTLLITLQSNHPRAGVDETSGDETLKSAEITDLDK